MDIAMIEGFVKRVEASQLYKITIEDHDQSITVVNSRRRPQNNIDLSSKSTSNNPVSFHHTNNQDIENLENLQILSPHVGYMRLSADGATDNLVQQGDTIEEGQTLGFVEVLTKLLPITSDKSGTISEILVEEGQVVEYGQAILQLAE